MEPTLYRQSIYKIEGIQRRMCELIPEVRGLPYRDQLKFLGILSSGSAMRVRYKKLRAAIVLRVNAHYDEF